LDLSAQRLQIDCTLSGQGVGVAHLNQHFAAMGSDGLDVKGDERAELLDWITGTIGDALGAREGL
jgi:hypothetical protein